MGKADVARFFFDFPIARECRFRFVVFWAGAFWMFMRCCFGFSLCPYYCATWSAEIKLWLAAAGIVTAHFIDDWFTTDHTRDKVDRKLHRTTKIFAKAGFELNPDKFEIGQCIVYLGLIIDSVTMRMRIDATAVRAFLPQLIRYRDSIIKRKAISSSEVRHVAGKLGWYSEVTLSGRLRTRAWWLYVRYGKDI
jgi:hypothetical protein